MRTAGARSVSFSSAWRQQELNSRLKVLQASAHGPPTCRTASSRRDVAIISAAHWYCRDSQP
jgi:hypothetical protein